MNKRDPDAPPPEHVSNWPVAILVGAYITALLLVHPIHWSMRYIGALL